MAPSPRLEVTRYQADLNDADVATAQTVQLMCDQIERAAQDPVLRRAAGDAVRRFRGGPLYAAAGIDCTKSPDAIASSIWWWVKHALKFQLHNAMIQVWFNERDQLQLLISPDLLLRMNTPRGDCAIFTMLECAMLRAWGIPYELVTAAVTPNSPDLDHIWARAVFPDGQRLNLDASHGEYPGWQVPFEHRNRTQVWDSGGNPIPDAAPRSRGLHAYQARPNKPILPKRLAVTPGVRFRDVMRTVGSDGIGLGRYQRRGLGQSAADSIAMAEQADYGTIPASTPVQVSAPGFNWAGTIGGLLNSWTQIASNVIAPRNTITTGPQGTSVNVAAGTQLPSGALLTSSIAGITASPLLWILGGGVLLFLFSQMGKR